MSVEHSAITDPEIHESKGVSTASNNQVYVANGAGSGTWKLVKQFIDLDYGEMTLSGNATVTAIASASTYTTVAGTYTLGHASGVTLSTNKLVISQAGTYRVAVTASLIGGTADVFKMDLAKGDVAIGHPCRVKTANTSDVVNISSTGIQTFAANDEITLVIMNETNADDCTVTDCTVSVVQMHS